MSYPEIEKKLDEYNSIQTPDQSEQDEIDFLKGLLHDRDEEFNEYVVDKTYAKCSKSIRNEMKKYIINYKHYGIESSKRALIDNNYNIVSGSGNEYEDIYKTWKQGPTTSQATAAPQAPPNITKGSKYDNMSYVDIKEELSDPNINSADKNNLEDLLVERDGMFKNIISKTYDKYDPTEQDEIKGLILGCIFDVDKSIADLRDAGYKISPSKIKGKINTRCKNLFNEYAKNISPPTPVPSSPVTIPKSALDYNALSYEEIKNEISSTTDQAEKDMLKNILKQRDQHFINTIQTQYDNYDPAIQTDIRQKISDGMYDGNQSLKALKARGYKFQQNIFKLSNADKLTEVDKIYTNGALKAPKAPKAPTVPKGKLPPIDEREKEFDELIKIPYKDLTDSEKEAIKAKILKGYFSMDYAVNLLKANGYSVETDRDQRKGILGKSNKLTWTNILNTYIDGKDGTGRINARKGVKGSLNKNINDYKELALPFKKVVNMLSSLLTMAEDLYENNFSGSSYQDNIKIINLYDDINDKVHAITTITTENTQINNIDDLFGHIYKLVKAGIQRYIPSRSSIRGGSGALRSSNVVKGGGILPGKKSYHMSHTKNSSIKTDKLYLL